MRVCRGEGALPRMLQCLDLEWPEVPFFHTIKEGSCPFTISTPSFGFEESEQKNTPAFTKKMQAFMGPMRIVTVAAVILCLTVLGTDGNKANSCCTEVSSQAITVPILGYRIQLRNPPCVRAIIFMTEEGEKCSHWKESWVFQKVQELERARKRQAKILSQ